MKIAHVSQPSDGGCAVVVRELAKAGVAHGDAVTVFSPPAGLLAEWTPQVGAVHCPLSLQRGLDVSDLLTAARLRHVFRDFDVVHLHSSKAGFVGRLALAAMRDKPRSVFTPHGWSWYVGGRAAGVYRAVERWLAPLADVIAVVSAGERDDGAAVLRSRGRMQVVENGVDCDHFAERVTRPSNAPEFPFVVQVGRLSHQKAQDRTIEALAQVDSRSVFAVFVGDGDASSHEDLLAAADAAGLDRERLRFVGFDDPRAWLQHATVVVLPSRWEGMSLALLEALAAGSAIVTTDCSGADAAKGASVVLEGDPNPSARLGEDALVTALARAIDDLITDDQRRLGLCNQARRRGAQFSFAKTYGQYRQLYERA